MKGSSCSIFCWKGASSVIKINWEENKLKKHACTLHPGVEAGGAPKPIMSRVESRQH